MSIVKKIPKAITSHFSRKRERRKIVKRKERAEGREGKTKGWEKENKMAHGKNANGPSILLIVTYKFLSIMSNNF